MNQVFIGYDPREDLAFEVCKFSIKRRTGPLEVFALKQEQLRMQGLYTRPWVKHGNQLKDLLSDAPMSTEFSNTRWLTPFLSSEKWSLFMDPDMLVLADIKAVFDQADDRYAVMCVKHQHNPSDKTKMDGCLQTQYNRKNWSSFMLFNKEHPANARLTLDLINSVPGRDLHRFCWLQDEDIGALDEGWNWLEGHSSPDVLPIHNIHFTRGGPWFENWQDVAYADIWKQEHAEYLKHR